VVVGGAATAADGAVTADCDQSVCYTVGGTAAAPDHLEVYAHLRLHIHAHNPVHGPGVDGVATHYATGADTDAAADNDHRPQTGSRTAALSADSAVVGPAGRVTSHSHRDCQYGPPEQKAPLSRRHLALHHPPAPCPAASATAGA